MESPRIAKNWGIFFIWWPTDRATGNHGFKASSHRREQEERRGVEWVVFFSSPRNFAPRGVLHKIGRFQNVPTVGTNLGE